jgi:sec-independent protein translocase protein TatC
VAAQLQLVVGSLERPGSGVSPATRASLAGVSPQLHGAIERLSAPPQGDKPVTLGIGEPFTTTIGIAFIFALILSLPVLLYELYGFALPAFSPEQRRITTPLMLAIPFLFVAGVLFGYFVVLPAAVRFFQNFNSGEFNVLVQASAYYHFAAVTLLAMGLVFQVPVGILAVTRAGIVTPRTLRSNRRYALVACGAVAALLPGDAITLLLETVPLYLLFELGVLLASAVERREARRAPEMPRSE